MMQIRPIAINQPLAWMLLCLAFFVAGCAERTGVYSPVNLQPVNFWWHFNPSKTATWDYFSPIPDEQQPITILQREGDLPKPPGQHPGATGTISQPGRAGYPPRQ